MAMLGAQCSPCCGDKCYAKFEWIDDPPPSASAFRVDQSNPATDPVTGSIEGGFCACYWKPFVPLSRFVYSFYGTAANPPGRLYGGYVSVGGVSHSRHYAIRDGVIASGARVRTPERYGVTGSFSGPSAAYEKVSGGFPFFTNYSPSCFYLRGSIPAEGPVVTEAPSIAITGTSLYIKHGYYCSGPGSCRGDVLAGLHTPGTGDILFEGVTVDNVITGPGEYRYRVSVATEEDVTQEILSTDGRSVRDCSGNYFAASPWTATITWPDDVSAPFPGFQGTLGSSTRKITANTQWRSINNNQPLEYEFLEPEPNTLAGRPLNEWSFGPIAVSIERSLRVFIGPNAVTPKGTLIYPACGGCQSRHMVEGFTARAFIRSVTPGNEDYLVDTIVFKAQMSQCFENGSGNSFTVTPTRRDVSRILFIGGFYYGYGLPTPAGTPTLEVAT